MKNPNYSELRRKRLAKGTAEVVAKKLVAEIRTRTGEVQDRFRCEPPKEKK